MQPLSSDREEKDGGVTRIEWECIVSAQASERNPREFIVNAIPNNKKKQGINKANAQQLVFSCRERNRLLTELLHKLHMYNGEKPYLVEKALHQTHIYKEGLKKMVVLRLYPTIIQVVVKSRDKKNVGKSQKNISSIAPHHLNHLQEESKRMFDESFEGSEAYDPNELYFEDDEENEDEDMEGYESEGQGFTDTILTPYKGTMIGGTALGEESAVPNLTVDQISKTSYSQHFIYLCEIDRVYTSQNILVIVKKNQEIEKFFFRNENKMKEFVNMLKKNYKETYKNVLLSQIFANFDLNKIFEDLDFVKREGKRCYCQEATTVSWDGHMSNIVIELDEKYIYEVDKATDSIRKRCLLKDLEIVRTVEKSQLYNLVLLFKKEVEIMIYIGNSNDREKLLSAILSLRNLVLPPFNFVDTLTILINSQLDFSQKILGHDALDASQFIQDYEGLVFRKITENISYKDNMKLNNLIEEAILNTTFANLIKIDQKNIKVIMKEINSTVEQYLFFEFCDSQIVDAALKKNNDDFIIDYFGFKKKLPPTNNSLMVLLQQNTSNAQFNQDVSRTINTQNVQLYNEDGGERLKQYEQLSEKTTKYLNLLNFLLNSKVVFNEIAEHEDLLLNLIKLLTSKNPFLSFLTSQVLKQTIQHYSGNEFKAEQINKRLLIRGSQSIQAPQGQTSIDQLQNAQSMNIDLGENNYLFQAIKEYLLYYDYLQDNYNVVKSLHLFSICNILRSILFTRKASTRKEEIKVFADMIIEDDPRYLSILEEEKQNQRNNQGQNETKKGLESHLKKREDPLKNKPMFHLVDKFCLLGFQNFDIQYMFTLILNETLSYLKKYELDKLVQMQQYILTYSVQFIWQLFLQIESPIQEQRKTSIQTLSKILYQFQDSIHLLLRCFPKTLIEKVETHIDLFSSFSWQDQEWEDFFLKITNNNYDTATEQWNDETRQELKQKLQEELNEFLEAKKLHKQVISDENKKELILPNHEFNRDKRVISRSVNLKWNYMEFSVKYNCLNSKFLVWKYYLTKLLVEQNLHETQRPFFTEIIKKPVAFWQELKIKFMSSFDKQEQIIILKTMCVLYNNHYRELKDIKTIPYFLKLFDQRQYQHCHFILMQLIHVALSIEREQAIKNMKKFIKSDGLNVLFRQLKLVFKELNRPNRGKQNSLNPQLLVLSTYSREQYEKLINGDGVLQDQANFTNSNTNSRYFRRNSKYVCMGVLVFKILDIIFKEMHALDYVPLPSNREFLLRKQSLAILAQTLMIENIDLTREMTLFIQMHMNNHYSYYRLKNSGMIEYLILCLSTRNGDRALEILQKFQEVSFDIKNHQSLKNTIPRYNQNNLKLGSFNANDLKMIEEDNEWLYQYMKQDQTSEDIQNPLEQKKYMILAESIFLRFLPIPLIKFLYEEGQDKFLEVYKLQQYESPILIWNAELRQILEESIRVHASDFIQKLQDFAKQPSHDLKMSDSMPIYDKSFDTIVQYPSIQNEVRCGRYYLRVWVNQNQKDDANFFDIPVEEEDKFYRNLQTELRHCIYENQFRDHQKIIILFKACLLSLQRFKTKKIFCIVEVNKILKETCKKRDLVYDATVKEMIYIGIKFLYQVIRSNNTIRVPVNVPSNAPQLQNQMYEILKQQEEEQKYQQRYKLIQKEDYLPIKPQMICDFITDVFNLILKNSFSGQRHPRKRYSVNTFQEDENNEQNQWNEMLNDENLLTTDLDKITIDRTETKTLTLCVYSFIYIFNFDTDLQRTNNSHSADIFSLNLQNVGIQSFLEQPLAQRSLLFRQIAKILDISFTLLPLFKDRQLTNYIYQPESKTYSSYNHFQAAGSPRGKQSRKKSKQRKNEKSKKRKSKAKHNQNNQQSQNQISIINQNQPQINQDNQNFRGQQNIQLIDLDKFNFIKQQQHKEKKRVHKKDPNINYKEKNLLEIIKDTMDKHSIELIFELTRAIFELTKEITQSPVLHPELITTGMPWKALKYIYFTLKEERMQFQDLRGSLREATLTLKNLIMFANELATYGAESFAFKNLNKEAEKEVILNFWKCIKRIFGKKILETLFSQFVINNNEIVFANFDPRRFLNQFSVKEEESPELVWNNETRLELFNALENQIVNLKASFFDKLVDFEYSVNNRELRVEEIFIRHFNNTNDFKTSDILSYQQRSIATFAKSFTGIDNFAQKIIEKLKQYIDDGLKFIADLNEQDNINCLELVKAFKNLLINENIIIHDQDKFDDYLSTFCNLIMIKPDLEGNLNPSPEESQMIAKMSYLVLEIITHISKNGGIHFDYLKTNNDFIRLMIRSLYSREREIIDSQQVITIFQNMLQNKELDINNFLIGTGLIMFILNQIFERKPQNANMRERIEFVKLILQANQYTSGIYSKYIPKFFFVELQQKQLNDPETDKIIEFLRELDSQEFENVFIIWNADLKRESHARIKNNCEMIVKSYDQSDFKVDLDLKDLINPKLEHEIIVSDVIIRVYNKNPAVFINIKLNNFIQNLSQEILQIAQELFKIGQQHKDEFSLYDDEFPRDNTSNSSLQRKFRSLCNQSLILMTALLLSIEQLILNDYNQNRLMASKKEEKNAETKFYKQIIEKTTDQTQLDHKVYQILGFWLQTQVFLNRYIPVEIRITFLQIIFLIIDLADAVKVLKDNQSLIQFITDSISNIYADKFQKTIEEAFILLITQKMLRKDSEPTPILITNSLQKLFKIYEKKKKLKKLIEFILALMATDQQYKQSVVEFIKQNQSIKMDLKILEGRQENSDHTEAIMRIWRGKPSSLSDAKHYYDITECYHIEEKLEETNIPKMKLPLLSKKSAHQFNKDDLFYEEEKKKELPFAPSKEEKLGYKPVLDEVLIGGNDLENIEIHEESFNEDDDV